MTIRTFTDERAADAYCLHLPKSCDVVWGIDSQGRITVRHSEVYSQAWRDELDAIANGDTQAIEAEFDKQAAWDRAHGADWTVTDNSDT